VIWHYWKFIARWQRDQRALQLTSPDGHTHLVLIIPPPTRSSGRRYSIFQQKFLSFSFANGSSRWLYRQGTFIAQKVGYRCNLKNFLKFGGQPPLKFGDPKPPNVVTQSRDVVQTYSRNRSWERVSKTGLEILGALPKKIWGGQSLEISIFKLALLRGQGPHSLQIFTSGSGNSPWKGVPKTGIKIWGLPPKNLRGCQS